MELGAELERLVGKLAVGTDTVAADIAVDTVEFAGSTGTRCQSARSTDTEPSRNFPMMDCTPTESGRLDSSRAVPSTTIW